MVWMPASEAASFQEKWVWASVMPGIRVAPAASTTSASPAETPPALRPTATMRLPRTRTLPA